MTDRLPHVEMVDGLRRMITSKSDWLETFSEGSKKRPDHEIEVQRQHLSVLQQAADDYQRAADRPATRGAA
jgi:hypothetical protein